MISRGENKAALKKLSEDDLKDPDLIFYKALLLSWEKNYDQSQKILKELIDKYPERLDFYNQLGRVYAWQGEFEKAEEIILKAKQKEFKVQQLALLAQFAEWQNKWFKAERLRKEAFYKCSDAELKSDYYKFWQKAKKKTQSQDNIKLSINFDSADSDSRNLKAELEYKKEIPLNDYLNFTPAFALYKNSQISSYILRTTFKVKNIFKNKFSTEVKFNYQEGEAEENFNSAVNLSYDFNKNNRASLYFNDFDYKYKSDYQSLELEYKKEFKDFSVLLNNTSRNYDGDYNFDFSRRVDLYFPLQAKNLKFSFINYDSGENRFEFALEFYNLFENRNWRLNLMSAEIDDRGNSSLDLNLKENINYQDVSLDD